MDLPPLPDDDPLARDTRGRLFELLGQLGRTATTDELSVALGLHANGIRRHLEQLQQAGLIRRHSIRQRRGRPRDGWSLDPDARPGGAPPRGYEELGQWLARAIPARPDNLRDIEATGRMIGRELARPEDPASEGTSASGLEDFARAVTWLGFAPRVAQPSAAAGVEVAAEEIPAADGTAAAEQEPADAPRVAETRITYSLGNCPYRQAVEANQPVICTLHKGILSGLLETLEPSAEITAFRPRDPATAGCTVTLLLDGGSRPRPRRPAS